MIVDIDPNRCSVTPSHDMHIAVPRRGFPGFRTVPGSLLWRSHSRPD